MKLETVKIDIGGGDTVTVYKEVLRVTARLHEAELKKCMTPVERADGNGGKMLLSDMERMETEPKRDFLVDTDSIDNDAINLIYMLNQTEDWTLGPITAETVDRLMTRDQYKALVKELDVLYKPVPLVEGAA